MKKNEALMRALLVIATVVGFISIGAKSTTLNPKAAPASSPSPRQAYTVPVSESKLTFLVTVDDRKPVKVAQLDGGIIRVEKAGSSTFAFSPYVTNRETKEIALKAFEITEVSDGKNVIGERIREIGNIEAASLNAGHVTVWNYHDSRFTFHLQDIKVGEVIDYGELKPETLSLSGNICCIECDGVRICACEVTAQCGSCCAGRCCEGTGMMPNSKPPST